MAVVIRIDRRKTRSPGRFWRVAQSVRHVLGQARWRNGWLVCQASSPRTRDRGRHSGCSLCGHSARRWYFSARHVYRKCWPTLRTSGCRESATGVPPVGQRVSSGCRLGRLWGARASSSASGEATELRRSDRNWLTKRCSRQTARHDKSMFATARSRGLRLNVEPLGR